MERYRLSIYFTENVNVNLRRVNDQFLKDETAFLGCCKHNFSFIRSSGSSNKATCQIDEVKWKQVLLQSAEDIQARMVDYKTEYVVEDLSGAIHSLLDQLPIYGSYLLDVLVDCELSAFKSTDDEQVHLLGALLRAVSLHNGLITLVCHDLSPVNEWTSCLRTCMIALNGDDNGAIHKKPVALWRGSLRIGNSNVHSVACDSIPGFHLAWQGKDKRCSFPFSKCQPKDDTEILIVADEIVILQLCSLKSIPLYLVTPDKYQLYVPERRHGCDGANKLIHFLKLNPAVCLVAKLSYATYRDPKYLRHRSLRKSEDWRKAILDFNVKDFEKCEDLKADFNGETHFIVFVDESCAPFGALALQLRHPSEIDFVPCTSEVGSDASLSKVDRKDIENLLNDLPRFTFNETHRPQRKDIEFQPQPLPIADPSDWLERRYLLLRSFKEKESFGIATGDETASIQINDLEVGDIPSLFDASGERKHNDSVVVRHKKRPLKPYNSLNETKSATWPDVIHCHFHDLYYNATEAAELKESQCNRMKEQCVASETVSTCNSDKQTGRQIVAKTSCKRKRNASGIAPRRSPRKISKMARHSDGASKTVGIDRHVTLRRSPRKHLQQAPVRRETKAAEKKAVKGWESQNELSEKHRMKLREAVVVALEKEGIGMDNALFAGCGRRLFNVCKAFVSDVIGKGSTSLLMKKIAEAHVKQVIDFENLKNGSKSR